jgi:L-lactate utilization protein LutC
MPAPPERCRIDFGQSLFWRCRKLRALGYVRYFGAMSFDFIPQYLAIIVNKKDIVATMNQVCERIGNQEYCFGTFIAGSSKTADIEQSLVLGANGTRGLTVFLME